NNDTVPPATPGAYLYSKFVGIIYYFTGRTPFIAQYFNVFFGFFTVYFVYKLICEIGGSKKAALAGSFITAIFPTLNLYSAVILRENIITFFSLLSVYYFVKWLKSGKLFQIIISSVFLGVASSVHGAMIIVGGVYLFFFCFYKPLEKRWRLLNKQALFAICITAAVVILFRARLLNKLPSDITLVFSPEYLKSRLVPLAVGRTAYLESFYPKSFLDIFIQTPIRVIYFLLMPFPWKISGVSDIIGVVDALIYAALIFFSLKSFRKSGYRYKVIFIGLIFIIILEMITFSWGTSNYGTAIRHRQKFVCLLITMASIGRYGSEKPEENNIM
ncbi:MAG: phospholipid carrier-dependent glycosyltransferase, partial [Bacillota bacterium]|nr:phospholipid carrier-dependent glycosyltransferase [Bacillota bacterium]